MNEHLDLDDIMLGIEMGYLTQEQVVSEFSELAERDIVAAATRYTEFVDKLEHVSSGGDAQIRSVMGGPDPLCRARLVDIMAASYATAGDDVKERIRDEALRPLLRDNLIYVRMAVARMTNPHLVGDIIRDQPVANPGFGYYEEDLLKSGDLDVPGKLQLWLDRFGQDMFAATTIAQQCDHEENVSRVVVMNEPLFRDAAHVAAAILDISAEIKVLGGSKIPKTEITKEYRGCFVDVFAEMVRQEAERANWLPVGAKLIQLYSR